MLLKVPAGLLQGGQRTVRPFKCQNTRTFQSPAGTGLVLKVSSTMVTFFGPIWHYSWACAHCDWLAKVAETALTAKISRRGQSVCSPSRIKRNQTELDILTASRSEQTVCERGQLAGNSKNFQHHQEQSLYLRVLHI